MKPHTPIFAVIVIVFLLAACGSPSPTQTSEPTQPIEAATGSPGPTEAATEPPADASPSQPPVQASAAETVIVTLADNTITTSETTFNVGVPYTFVITNEGRHEHKFSISQPVSLAGSLSAAESGALVAIGTDQLGPGDQVQVDFTFPASAVGTQLELACLIRRHYDDGMLQAITVLP